MIICDHCKKPFEPKRSDATLCSAACRKAVSRKRAREKEAEEGSPDVEYEYKERGPEPAPEVEVPVPAPRIESCTEIPVRADTNALARQVIANMKAYKETGELERLEKNQLK